MSSSKPEYLARKSQKCLNMFEIPLVNQSTTLETTECKCVVPIEEAKLSAVIWISSFPEKMVPTRKIYYKIWSTNSKGQVF